MSENGMKILVVDDEEMIVTILSNYLTEKGYQVTGLYDAKSAIELIQTSNFDVVFTDLMMPGINGMELVKAIRSQEVDTQIIIFTGYASVDSAIDAVQLGVYDYIKKPFSLEDIGSILNHALEEQQLKRENEVLNHKVEHMLSQITMLYDISNIIYQVKDKSSAIEMLFDTLAESMQIGTSFICECQGDGCTFQVVHSSRRADDNLNGLKFTSDMTFNGMTLSKNEPTVIQDLQGSLQVESDVLQVPEGWQHMIFIPVAYRNQLVGFLLVAGGQDQLYSLDDELTLLKILATQIAPIIGTDVPPENNMLNLKALEPARTMNELIKAELAMGDLSDTPISFALVRLLAFGQGQDEADFAHMREAWRNVIADQLGPDKRVHWAGIDTLLIFAVGGNPVGLDHHLANVRNDLESGKMSSESGISLSMAYAILTYPFDADSSTKIVRQLSSRLFYAASEVTV